jgi:hypothetical protein
MPSFFISATKQKSGRPYSSKQTPNLDHLILLCPKTKNILE